MNISSSCVITSEAISVYSFHTSWILGLSFQFVSLPLSYFIWQKYITELEQNSLPVNVLCIGIESILKSLLSTSYIGYMGSREEILYSSIFFPVYFYMTVFSTHHGWTKEQWIGVLGIMSVGSTCPNTLRNNIKRTLYHPLKTSKV